jgi:hypothetical protein
MLRWGMIACTAMRHCSVLGLVIATVAAASSSTTAEQSAALSVHDAVASYARGDFAVAVRDLDTRLLTVAPFTRALDAWIAVHSAPQAGGATTSCGRNSWVQA